MRALISNNFNLKLYSIFFIISSSGFFSSCAGTAKKVEQGEYGIEYGKPFDDLEQEIGGSGFSNNNLDEKYLKDKWRAFSSQAAYNPKDRTYDELRTELRVRCTNNIRSQIRIDIESEIVIEEQEESGEYSSLVKNYIKAQVRGSIIGKDVRESRDIETKEELKPEDTLHYTLYFDIDNYYKRIEKEKQEHEEKAVNYLKQARDASATGNLAECLTKMSHCHYSIMAGGMKAAYTDNNGNNIRVRDGLFDLQRKIGSNLSVDILDDKDSVNVDKVIHFRKSDPRKDVRLWLRWDGGNASLDEIEVKLVDKAKGNILGKVYTNESGFAEMDIEDKLQEDIQELDGYIKINMVPPGNYDKFYTDAEMFKDFENGILSESVEITNFSFPVHKIAIIVESPSNLDVLKNGVEDALREYGQSFFNIVGLPETDKTKLGSYLKGKKTFEFDMDEYRGYIQGILHVKFSYEAGTQKTRIDTKFYTLEKVESREALITDVYRGGATGIPTTAEAENAIIEFFDRYFLRNIALQLDPPAHPSSAVAKHVDWDEYYESQPLDKILLLERQSRYHNLKYEVNSDGYEPEIVEIPAKPFDFTNGPPGKPIKMDWPVPLVKKVGNLKISVIPEDKSRDKFDKEKVKITLKKKKWYFFTETDSVLTGKKVQYFTTDDFGKYQISVRHELFDPSTPKYKNIKYGNNPDIIFELKRKSPVRSQLMSAIIPGSGHKYMGKPWFSKSVILPATLSTLFRVGYVSSGMSYLGHRSQFKTNQKSWGDAETVADSDYYKQEAQNQWDQMKTAKAQFIGTFISAVMTNVVTSIWLWVTTA